MSSAISILALLSAAAATVLAFIFIVPEKKRASLNKIGKLLHDLLNFKFLIIEKVLQALYIFATAFIIMMGFFMLFYVQEGYFEDTWMGGYGLLTMILGPIVIRLAYEGLMMLILLVKNVIQINNKVQAPEGHEESEIFTIPVEALKPEAAEAPEAPVAPVAPAAPAACFCPNCGTKVEGAFCPSCGTKVQ